MKKKLFKVYLDQFGGFMSRIIAGCLGLQSQVQAAVEELQRVGFPPDQIASFYVNSPGQHDMYRLGGDDDSSPGAQKMDVGALKGIAAGATAGLATVPLLGPVGLLLGAYVGALIGALAATDDAEPVEMQHSAHKCGLIVVVAANATEQQDCAIKILDAIGASQIEIAEGSIRNGDWIDFDPLVQPNLLKSETQLAA